jgi:hypothetical protein
MWQVRLQVVRALPLFRWSRRERRRALAILERELAHPRTLVRASAVEALAWLAAGDPALRQRIERALDELERSRRASVIAQVHRVRQRLGEAASPPAASATSAQIARGGGGSAQGLRRGAPARGR